MNVLTRPRDMRRGAISAHTHPVTRAPLPCADPLLWPCPAVQHYAASGKRVLLVLQSEDRSAENLLGVELPKGSQTINGNGMRARS